MQNDGFSSNCLRFGAIVLSTSGGPKKYVKSVLGTWTPKVRKTVAAWALFGGFGCHFTCLDTRSINNNGPLGYALLQALGL